MSTKSERGLISLTELIERYPELGEMSRQTVKRELRRLDDDARFLRRPKQRLM